MSTLLPFRARLWLHTVGITSTIIAVALQPVSWPTDDSASFGGWVWTLGFGVSAILCWRLIHHPLDTRLWSLTPAWLAASAFARAISILLSDLPIANRFVGTSIWLLAAFTVAYRWSDLIPSPVLLRRRMDG